MGKIDFKKIAQAALGRIDELLKEWLPGGTYEGRYYSVLNPRRNDKSKGSFKINRDNGAWGDYAVSDAKGGDLISLYAYLQAIENIEAARILAQRLGIEVDPPKEYKQAKATQKKQWGRPTGVWEYHDIAGTVICTIKRYDVIQPDGKVKKEIVPELANGTKRHMPIPRPIFNLHLLAQNMTATVIICEGEKAASACQSLFSPDEFVVTTWPSGTSNVDKADWSPLKDRHVLIWPDDDEPGDHATEALLQRLLPEAQVASLGVLPIPPGSPRDGWDAYDAIEDGWTADDVRALRAQTQVMLRNVVAQRPQPAEKGPTWLPVIEPAKVADPVLTPMHCPEMLFYWAQGYAEETCVWIDAPVMSAIVGCAACITADVSLRTRPPLPHREMPTLWACLIGMTSTRKSSVLEAGLKFIYTKNAALKKQNDQAKEEYEKAMKRYKLDMTEWEEDYKKARKKNITYLQDPPTEPKKPPKLSLIVEDITVEALQLVARDNPRGIIAVYDEIKTWFGQMSRQTGETSTKEEGIWLKAYNSQTAFVQRVSREELVIPRFRVNILAGSQPEHVQKWIRKSEKDGMTGRYQFIQHRRTPLAAPPTGVAVLSEENRKVPEMLQARLYEIKQQEITFTPSAQELFNHTEYRYDKALEGLGNEHWRGWLGKKIGLLARVALVFHCIDEVLNWPSDQPQPLGPLPLETLQMAIRFVDEFLEPHNQATYLSAGVAAGMRDSADVQWDEEVKAIVVYLAKKYLNGTREITPTDLQNCRVWRSQDQRRRHQILEILEASNVIKMETPGMRWKASLNPALIAMAAE